MGAAVAITPLDLTASELRKAAQREKDSTAARRMLALALVLEGADRRAGSGGESSRSIRCAGRSTIAAAAARPCFDNRDIIPLSFTAAPPQPSTRGPHEAGGTARTSPSILLRFPRTISARGVFRCRFPSAARSEQGMKRAELMTICRSVSPLASFPDAYSLWENCPALALRYEFTRNSNVKLVDALRVNFGTPRCGGKHSSSASTIFRWVILLVV